MQDSVYVTLSEPVEYDDKQSTDQVEIKCPSFRSVSDQDYYGHLKGVVANVMMEMADGARESKDGNDGDKDAEESSEIKPNMMTYVLISKLGDKFTNELRAFESRAHLFCFLAGTAPLKDGTLSRIHLDDRSLLLGTFVANFIMPGLMKLMSGND